MSQLMYLETKVLVISQAKHEHALAASMFLGTSVLTGAGQADVTPGRSDLPWVSGHELTLHGLVIEVDLL